MRLDRCDADPPAFTGAGLGVYPIPQDDRICYPVGMNPLLLIVILLLLFGGGGFYFGGPAIGGGAIGLILLILLVMYLSGGLRGRS